MESTTNADIRDSDESELDEEFITELAERNRELKRKKLEEHQEQQKNTFLNPLAIADGEAKLPNYDEDGFGSDADIPEGLEREKKPKKMPKTEKPTFEEVPVKSFSDYDSDDIAEIRAIGKKML